MAKFKNDNLDLETGENIDFDDADTIKMGYDGAELYINSTVSGVRAAQPYHMVRYDQLTEISGELSDHGNLDGLQDDDHQQYILADGTRELTGDWITGSGVQVPWLQFDTTITGIPPHSTGMMHWNNNDGTLDLDMPGGEVHLQIGQEQLVRVFNDSGSLIPNGSLVYISGAQGDRPLIELARADSIITTGAVGMTTEDIPDKELGFVTTAGIVRDIDTSGIPAGSLIYLSGTVAGGFTDQRPVSPHYKVLLGYVIRDHAQVGAVIIKPIITPRLMSLSDVLRETPTEEGQFLRWTTASGRFELTNSYSIDHGTLSGIDDDDHIYYVPTDGSRGFSSTVSGVDAIDPYHLVTYRQLTTLSGNLQDQIDTSSSGVETFLDLTDTPTTYSGYAGSHVLVNELENGLIFVPEPPGTIVSGTTPPLSSDLLWYNGNDNNIYYYDTSRGKWLTVFTHNYLFTYSGNIDGLYMSVGNVVNSYAHYHILRDATITSITADQDLASSQPDKGYEIQTNGISVFNFNMVAHSYTNENMNTDISAADSLQMYVVAAGARVRDPIVTLELKWRYQV